MNPHYNEYRFPQISQIPWEKVFKPNTNPEAIKFVSSLLVYNPKDRPHPLEALEDQYFDELRNQNTRLPNGEQIPSTLFEFTQEEIDYARNYGRPDLVDGLIPTWFKADRTYQARAQREEEPQEKPAKKSRG